MSRKRKYSVEKVLALLETNTERDVKSTTDVNIAKEPRG